MGRPSWGARRLFLPNDTEIAIFFGQGCNGHLTQVSAEIGEKLIFHFKFIGGMDVGERRKHN